MKRTFTVGVLAAALLAAGPARATDTPKDKATAYARADITSKNRLSLRLGFYERFLADQSESGLRLGDLSLTYTRFVPLPKEFALRLSAALTAPTSFYSQKQTLITAPTVSAALS